MVTLQFRITLEFVGFEHKAQRNIGQQTSLIDRLFPKQIFIFFSLSVKRELIAD